MKAIKKLMLKYGSSLAALALMIGVSSSSQACWWWYNQPKEPEGMKKFVKEDYCGTEEKLCKKKTTSNEYFPA